MNNKTALSLAIRRKGTEEVVQVLLEAGVDVNKYQKVNYSVSKILKSADLTAATDPFAFIRCYNPLVRRRCEDADRRWCGHGGKRCEIPPSTQLGAVKRLAHVHGHT